MKKNKPLIPKRRFKEFEGDGEWKEKKLDEIVDVLDGDRGTNYPSGNDLQKTGHTLFLSATNVTKDGFRFDNNRYITEEKSNVMGNGKLLLNDIVLTSRGSIGHVAFYNLSVQKQIPFARINSGMLILRSPKGIQSNYIAEYLKTPLGKKQIDLISFGSAQPQLTKKDVSSYILSFPKNINEQSKISTLFQYIDELIILQQHRIKKTIDLKSAYFSEMFPKEGEKYPKKRFEGFTETWEKQKVSDISTMTYGGGTPRTTVKEYWTGDIPWISSSDLEDHKVLKIAPEKYINNYAIANSATKLVPKNSLAVVTRVGVGKLALVPYSYTTSQDFLSISNLKVDKYFSVYALYRVLQSEKNETQGTSIKGITKNELLDKNIVIPLNKEEQIKIGRFFKNIDTQIDLEEQKLEKLEQLKQAYLNELFV